MKTSEAPHEIHQTSFPLGLKAMVAAYLLAALRALAGWYGRLTWAQRSTLAALTAIMVVTYWSAMTVLVGRWYGDPDYAFGFLVPVFAIGLVWYRRGMFLSNAEKDRFEDDEDDSWFRRLGSLLFAGKSALWGLLLIAFAGAMRMASSYYDYDLLDPASLIPCLAGLTLFVGGWKALGRAWPAIVFLVFMVPLPGFVANRMGLPLQHLATVCSTFVIQTIGISAVAEGNVISLSDSQIGVAEACSGLHNMMLFVAVCVGMVFLLRRTLAEKIVIVLSSAVIALLANVVRIAVTAILHQTINRQAVPSLDHNLHFWAGFFMIPLAVIFLWIELAYLNRVFVRQTPSDAY